MRKRKEFHVKHFSIACPICQSVVPATEDYCGYVYDMGSQSLVLTCGFCALDDDSPLPVMPDEIFEACLVGHISPKDDSSEQGSANADRQERSAGVGDEAPL